MILTIIKKPSLTQAIASTRSLSKVVGALMTIAMATVFYAPQLAAESEANSDAPFLDLMDTKGESADFEAAFNNGKWTLVKIWQANCHVCGEQAPVISAAHEERDDFSVVGISVDGRGGLAGANRFLKRHGPTYPNFVGELSIVAVNFQLLTEAAFRGTPSYLLFDPNNKLMAAQAGLISKEALFGFIDKNS